MNKISLISCLFLITCIAVFSNEDIENSFIDQAHATSPSYMGDDYRLFGNPTYCLFEKDNKYNSKLLWDTKYAIDDWESKLAQYTGNENDWKIYFDIIHLADQTNEQILEKCDVRVRYVEAIPEHLQDEFSNRENAGITENFLTYWDVWILYLEPEYVESRSNSEWIELIPTGKFQDKYSDDTLQTLKHEIGHTLGLDHPESSFRILGDKAIANSIMANPDDYFWKYEQVFEITDFDVNSVVDLYGEKGFNSYSSIEEFYMDTVEGCQGDVKKLGTNEYGYPDYVCCPEGFKVNGESCIDTQYFASSKSTYDELDFGKPFGNNEAEAFGDPGDVISNKQSEFTGDFSYDAGVVMGKVVLYGIPSIVIFFLMNRKFKWFSRKNDSRTKDQSLSDNSLDSLVGDKLPPKPSREVFCKDHNVKTIHRKIIRPREILIAHICDEHKDHPLLQGDEIKIQDHIQG